MKKIVMADTLAIDVTSISALLLTKLIIMRKGREHAVIVTHNFLMLHTITIYK